MKRLYIRIYVTPKLYLRIADYADEIGLNVAEYMKHIVIEKVDPVSLKKGADSKK